MSGLQAVTAVTISGALVLGMVLALLGSVKLSLARELQAGEGRIGTLLSALSVLLIPMMLLAGLLLDWLGVRAVLLLGSLITSLALSMMSLAPTYQRAFVAILLAGMGMAALNTAVVVLMPEAFFLHADVSARLNLGFVFIALGALLTPVLADLFLRTLRYHRTILILALVCLVPAFLCFIPAFRDEVAHQARELHRPTTNLWEETGSWHVLLAGLVFLFYAPLEGAVGVWSTTFLTQGGYSERRAAWVLSGYWLAFLLSRLGVALWQPKAYWDPWLIILPALLAAVVLGNLAGTGGKLQARNGLLLLGFLLGPIFPTLVGVLFREFPNDRGMVYGVTFGLGSLGSLLLSPVVGVQMRNTSAQQALRIIMLIALFLAAVATVFGLVVGSGR
jgi:MFS family permease